jgi:hypothetical protein
MSFALVNSGDFLKQRAKGFILPERFSFLSLCYAPPPLFLLTFLRLHSWETVFWLLLAEFWHYGVGIDAAL